MRSKERIRARKKQKRLDAICEKVYNSNRLIGGFGNDESNEGSNVGGGLGSEEKEVRRSSRVRKAPVFLDASPSPLRKKQRVDNGGGSLSGKNEGSRKGGDQFEKDSGDGEEKVGWKSRLRSRAHDVGFEMRGTWTSPRRKKINFDDSDVSKEELKVAGREMGAKKEGGEGGEVVEVVKSPPLARSKKGAHSKGKRSLGRKVGDQSIEVTGSNKEGNNDNVGERLLALDEEDKSHLKSSVGDGREGLVANDEEGRTMDGLRLDEEQTVGRDVEALEQRDEQMEQAECEKEGVTCMEEVGHPINEVGNEGSTAGKDACPAKPGRKSLEDDVVVKVDRLKQMSTEKPDRLRIGEGRRCGLCGRGTDGKPPKRLVKDFGDSDNEAYGGSSSSEEANYDKWDGFGDEPDWLGRLLGPIHDRFGIADVWVHQHCAVWSPEVYFAGPRCLKNVRAALFRGRALKCSRCGRPGATIGCRVDRCPKTYHLPCGRADGCVFDHRKFLIACVDHRHLFQPQGHHYLHRIKKLKAKKLKLEMKKLSHDAWRKDYEAEEKWLEHNGEDEEFLRREGKRLHRDILRIAPVYIGGSSADNEKLYQGWESVAGLQDVIQCMKEVVLLPLLYPEFFSSLGLTPPRGVLLHGYPGTGKTLVVRALIGSCARGDRRIAYFARKGADCLGKYVGDAERQLRLLFQVAEKSQPSIIFFDEIDGLAPCRTRQQDQTHNSVVSTLLALMDGLKSRGSVVVIGATNRPDAVDPALRRPGRFDREIYFPLPSVKDRAAILSVHTQRWPKPVSGALLKLVAQKTAGFAGADLQALCTQAAMIALKRNCAWQELMSVAEKKANKGRLLPVFSFPVEEKDWLDALACAPPPCSRREAGMAANDVVSSPLHLHLVHCLLEPLSHLLISLYRDERILLPPLLYKAAKLIKSMIISALEQKGRSNDFWWAFLSDLIKEADIARQIERCLFTAGLLTGASVSGNLDAKNDDTDACNEFELQKVNRATAPTRLKNGLHLSGRTSGFRVLITGHPKSGQRHLASCLLYGFAGCVEIQKVDLATISQEGHGDVTDGMTQILLKCLSKDLCVIYMPRIDLWAMEVLDQVDDRENYACESTCKSADTAGPYDSTRHASQLWNSFMEQVDAMNLSASLMILATSEVPSQDLPHRIGQFFTRDVLNFNDSSSSVHTIPRFLVQATGEIDYDTVISSSAVELSHNLVQQYVQLLHNRLHATNTLEECKPDDAIESNAETESHNNCAVIDMTDGVNLRTNSNGDACCNGDKSHQVTNGDDQSVPISNAVGNQDEEVRLCNSRDAVPRIHPNNRTIKGKSSLLLAISSFGYQILRYPHFSELCWATSKLKQGPCTDINGPWKGWPFNSCIIRPNSSLEKVDPGCSSGNLKSKEHSGLVRGLIAVGLLAYRGVYKSVREVSFEVRKVLELLVEQVSAKILDGKDRISFLRLLSQVAYLEDMVNSWAYTLQSLEQDSQMAFSNPRQTIAGDPDSCHTSVPDQVGTGAVNPNVSQENSIEVQVQEQCPPIVSADGGLDLPNSEESIIISEEPFRDMVALAHSAPGSILQVSKSSMLPVSNERTLNTQKSVTNAESRISKDHISVGVLNGGSRSSEQLNGVAKEGSILPPVAGLHLHNDLNVVTNSNSRKGSGQCNNSSKSPSSEDCTRDADQLGRTVNVTLNKNSSVSAVPKETCVYSCCCECLHSIYVLIKKILIHERQVSGSCSTVEDVHDVVASSSANLLSAVRGFSNVPSVSSSEFVDEKLRGENLGKVCACPDVGHVKLKRTSYPESSVDRVVVPLECSFHSESKCVNQSKSLGEKANACTNSLSGLGFNFFFRDNVLIRSEVDKDVLFHCQFEKLCLGALIEWISMIKQPLD